MPNFDAGRVHCKSTLQLRNSKPEFNWWLNKGNLIDSSILAGHWEPVSTWACERWVKPGMFCLDIGANIGYYTVLLSYLAGPTGCVIGVEPMGDACRVAEQHVALNNLDAAVFQLALSDRLQTVADGFFNYAWPPNDCTQKRCTYEETTLDAWLTKDAGRPVHFIKIDVDGYEFKLLRGAEETLKRDKPILLLEVCDYTLRAAAELISDRSYKPNSQTRLMLEYLQELGYLFYREEDDTPLMSLDEVLAIRDLSISSINILCHAQ